MSTVIRFKRKNTTGSDGITLLPGEPFFNVKDKKFYIGNSNGTPDDITKITSESDASNIVSFHIGSDSNNKYEKIINNVENVTGKINGKNISSIFESDGTTVKSSTSSKKLTTSAGSATQPIYFKEGVPVATEFELKTSVPAHAVFTDTTYNYATQTSPGLVTIGPFETEDENSLALLKSDSEPNTAYVDVTKINNRIKTCEESLTWGTF